MDDNKPFLQELADLTGHTVTASAGAISPYNPFAGSGDPKYMFDELWQATPGAGRATRIWRRDPGEGWVPGPNPH